MKIADKERLDFLQEQSITIWVGFSLENYQNLFPVFVPRDNLRDAIDRCIKSKEEWKSRLAQQRLHFSSSLSTNYASTSENKE